MANSFFIMIAGTVVNMAFTTTLAYPLSKSNLKGRNVVLNVIIVVGQIDEEQLKAQWDLWSKSGGDKVIEEVNAVYAK